MPPTKKTAKSGEISTTKPKKAPKTKVSKPASTVQSPKERKVGFYGAKKHPLGFFICFLMSLSPTRLKFYLQRIRKGK